MKLSSEVRNNPVEPKFFPVHLLPHNNAPELVPQHSHPRNYEWFFCVSGGGIQVVDHWQGRMTPGRLAVIPPGRPHVFCADPGGCDCEVLMLPPDWLEGTGAIMAEARNLLNFWKEYVETSGFRAELPPEAVEVVRNALRGRQGLGLCGAVFALLELAFRLPRPPVRPAAEPQDEAIRSVLCHLNNHFSRKITVNDAVRIAGISRSTFHRRFQAVTGLTFCRYLNRQRLTAVEWLANAGVPRDEAARRCGFGSRSNYYQQLKLERENGSAAH